MRIYSSFEEIDKEEIKLSIDQTKQSLSPVSLAGSIIGSIMQKALVLKAVSKIIGVKKVVASTKS